MLRKKHYQEQLLEKTENQLDKIEQLVHDLEFAQIQNKVSAPTAKFVFIHNLNFNSLFLQVLDGLKEGNEALKKIQSVFSITEVEKILEDSQDAIAKQNVGQFNLIFKFSLF